MQHLARWDWILIASSGGKDSQAMLDYVCALAREQGVIDRVVVVHCDLGRMEWAGTRSLVEEHARHYGVRLEIVTRPQGDLLSQVEKMGYWPRPTTRYCTSDHKRSQIYRVMTKLSAEWRATAVEKRACRILNACGLRAEESPGRKKKKPKSIDRKASNGRREVTFWLPIHKWKTADVWSRIRGSGVRYHRAYDLGMKRLSCVFCIFAPDSALMIAGSHNRALLAEYVTVETKIDHAFQGTAKKKLFLRVIQERLEAGEVPPTTSEDFTM